MKVKQCNTLGLEMLTTSFIVLKLLGKIDWSWWWVLAPVWGTLVIVLLVFAILWWRA
jgi:hypothetical protein